MRPYRHRSISLPTLLCGLAVALSGTFADPSEAGEAKVPAEVRAIRDLPYFDGKDADPRKHKLDLFLPKDRKDFPVLFFIHGGAWSSGDRKLYSTLGPIYARNGIGAVIISYRLSPQVVHPGHIEDVARAFSWTYKNIASFGGRPDRIFVAGQSAGGHLAALLATNEAYLKPHGLKPNAIRGVIPVSGIYLIRANQMRGVIGREVEAAASASPLLHVTGDEPPFLILYAESDLPRCDVMSARLRDELRKVKVEADVMEIKHRNHLSIMFQWMFNEADDTGQAVFRFIEKHTTPDATLKPR